MIKSCQSKKANQYLNQNTKYARFEKIKKTRDEFHIECFNNNTGFKRKHLKNYTSKDIEETERNFIMNGKNEQITERFSETLDPEELAKYEDDLNLYALNEENYHEKQVYNDILRRKKIKEAIIKKKMKIVENRIKNAIENSETIQRNLLTWDAKEQIKYLNLNEPEIWTAEKISQAFPITIESCKKLLKSKWAPKTLDQLIRHDEFAIENWKSFTEEENEEPSGPPINIYKEYKKTNKLNFLESRTGIFNKQLLKKSKFYNENFSFHESLLCKPGAFSMIVAGHSNSKAKMLFNRIEASESNNSRSKNAKNIQENLNKHELEKSFNKIKLNFGKK